MSRIVRTRGALGAAAVAALLLFAGCSDDGGDGATPAEAAAEQPTAPGAESAARALEEERTVIDVRTPEEFAAGHVEGAERVGLADADFADRIAALDPDGAYVVYCRSGNRSAQAAAEMQAAGLDVLDGGALTDMLAAGWTPAS